MFLPLSFAGLATKTDAAVVSPDGTIHITPLDSNYAVCEAQRQVVQFNGPRLMLPSRRLRRLRAPRRHAAEAPGASGHWSVDARGV
jgi:hypothetical protein